MSFFKTNFFKKEKSNEEKQKELLTRLLYLLKTNHEKNLEIYAKLTIDIKEITEELDNTVKYGQIIHNSIVREEEIKHVLNDAMKRDLASAPEVERQEKLTENLEKINNQAYKLNADYADKLNRAVRDIHELVDSLKKADYSVISLSHKIPEFFKSNNSNKLIILKEMYDWHLQVKHNVQREKELIDELIQIEKILINSSSAFKEINTKQEEIVKNVLLETDKIRKLEIIKKKDEKNVLSQNKLGDQI